MLRKAILIDREDTCWIKREVVRLVERDSLWGTIDIYALKVAVALDDTLTGSIVDVSACLAIIQRHHQAVILVTIHFPLGVKPNVLP